MSGETRFTPDDCVARFSVASALIVGNRQHLKQNVIDALEDGAKTVVLDFEHCGYIDSSGLGVLVSLRKKCEEAGAELWLRDVRGDVRALMEVHRLDTLFRFEDRR